MSFKNSPDFYAYVIKALERQEYETGSVMMKILYFDEREILGDIFRKGLVVEVLSPTPLTSSLLMGFEKMQTQYESFK